MDISYKAFISYSHRDARWAQWLLGALEGYRLPGSKTRGVGRIFRDRDEAGAGDLKDEIQRALTASEHLIVVASPNSARSKYVEAEIEFFAAHNAGRANPGRILTLIVDGEPNVSSGDEPDPRECFPPALRGGVLKPDGAPLEPLAADARSVGDGRTRALAKLVAGLMNIRYDTLIRRDLVRRRRTQILAASAAVVALGIAGGVTAVIVAGNAEQERLRLQEAAAQRDVRTLNAVSDAERARQLLEAGNPSAARELASKSLPLDGSTPFVPQAYDVLYRSLFDRAQEVGADLVGYHRILPVVLPLGDHAYLVYNDEGTVAIWTPSAGVVYRRADLAWETRPSLAADGSAVFVAGMSAIQRLSLPQRTWSAIDLSPVFGDLSMPAFTVAIDANTFYACHDWDLYKIAVDAQNRGTAVWDKPLGGPCTALALMPSGSALVGKRSAALEITPEGEEARSWGPAGQQNLERAYVTDDAIILAHGGGTWVYRNGATEPEIIPRGMDYYALSPDGRWFIYSDIDNERVVVNDLHEGTARDLNCVCLFEGYLGADRFMTAAEGSIEGHRLDTLESTGNVYTFASEAESFVYLEADNMLMALRRQGMDSVAFLDTDPNQTMVVDGVQDLRTALLRAAFAATDRIITRSPTADGLKLLDVSRPGPAVAIDAPGLTGLSALAAATPLANGKLAVLDALIDRVGYALGIHDGSTGEKLLGGMVLSEGSIRAGDRFVGMDTEAGLTVFDALTGTTTEPDDALLFDTWEIEGSDLFGASYDGTGTMLGAYRLGDGQPQVQWSQRLDTRVLAVCIAPAAGQTYLLRNIRVGRALLERRSLATGEVTASLEISRDGLFDYRDIPEVDRGDCDAASFRLRTYSGRQLRWDVKDAVFVPEDLSATPPRDDPVPNGAQVETLDALADARIGWDQAGSWLYDPSDDRVVATFASAGSRVSSDLYIAARGLVVVGFENGRVEVWDLRFPTAATIALDAHKSPVVALDYDPERQLLLSADSEGTIHLWPMPSPEDLLAATAP